jgi:hypothetical protein
MSNLRFQRFMVTISGCMIAYNLAAGVARIYQESWTPAALHAVAGIVTVLGLNQAIKNQRHAAWREAAGSKPEKEEDP